MLPVAILRFSPTEGPAYFADWLDRHALAWKLVALDEGAPVPARSARVCRHRDDGRPDERQRRPAVDRSRLTGLLRDAVARRCRCIGHCLGGQLLAKALGAPVVAGARSPRSAGSTSTSTPTTRAREWFGGRAPFATFQWHYDAFALPAGATRVLTNAYNANQAYVVDDRHIGMQCHVEMTRDLVETWLAHGPASCRAVVDAAQQSAADIRTRRRRARRRAVRASPTTSTRAGRAGLRR